MAHAQGRGRSSGMYSSVVLSPTTRGTRHINRGRAVARSLPLLGAGAGALPRHGASSCGYELVSGWNHLLIRSRAAVGSI